MAGRVGRYRAAFGADLTERADTWTWTDLTTSTQDNTAEIDRGRSPGSAQVEPATLTAQLSNTDGDLTPRHPGGQYYPNVVKGTPIRYDVRVGDPYLLATGAGIALSTPDSATLDVTGDLAGVVEVVAPLRYYAQADPTDGHYAGLILKWLPTSDERSYRFGVTGPTGRLFFSWSDDGTTAGTVTEASTLSPPKPASGPASYGWAFDADNGAGGYTIRWYYWPGTAAELITNLDDALFETTTDTTSGAQTIYAGTADLCLAGNGDSTIDRYAGGISRVKLYSGDLSTGTLIANPDVTAETAGDTSFSASTGETWTVGAAGSITDYRPRFYGELASISPGWPGNGTADTSNVVWQAAGPLRRMRQNDKTLDSPMRRTIGSPLNIDRVYAYWPLDDGSDATQAESATPTVPPLIPGGDMDFAADDTCPGSGAVINVREGRSYGWNATVPESRMSSPVSDTFRLELFAKLTPGASATSLMVWGFTGSTASYVLRVTSSAYSLTGYDSLGAQVDTVSNPWDSNWDDEWVYYSVLLTENGANVDVTVSVVPLEGDDQGSHFSVSDSWATTTFGRCSAIRNLGTAPTGGVSFGNFIVVDGSAGVGWLANADTSWDTEAATQRIARLCREQGIPVYIDGPPTGSLTAGVSEGVASMGPQLALPLLDLLEECALADHGYLGESLVDGGLTYRSGSSKVNQTAQLTVPASVVVQPFEPADDDQRMVTDLTVERTNGSRYRYVDDDAEAEAGNYEGAVTVNVTSDSALPHQASIRVIEATWPEMRYPQIVVELAKDSTLWEAWDQLVPGDLLVVTDLPAEHPTEDIAQLVEGWHESISPHLWTVALNTVPEGPWAAGVLDSSAASPDTDMRALDSDGSTLTSGITSTGTSMSVATASGPLWTTSAGQFPLAVELTSSDRAGGEIVTVSAIAGASSPQTFTISARSVNGVVRSWDAGTIVRVAYPIRLTI